MIEPIATTVATLEPEIAANIAQAATPARTVHCHVYNTDPYDNLTIDAPPKVSEWGVVADPHNPPTYNRLGWNHYDRCFIARVAAMVLTSREQNGERVGRSIRVGVNGVGGFRGVRWNVRIENGLGPAFTDMTRGSIRVLFMDYAG